MPFSIAMLNYQRVLQIFLCNDSRTSGCWLLVYLNEHPKYKPIVKISEVGCRIKHISNHPTEVLTRLERSKRESCFHLEGRNYFWQHGRALKLHAISSTSIWLVIIHTALKNDGVRQMGLWLFPDIPSIYGKRIHSCSSHRQPGMVMTL